MLVYGNGIWQMRASAASKKNVNRKYETTVANEPKCEERVMKEEENTRVAARDITLSLLLRTGRVTTTLFPMSVIVNSTTVSKIISPIPIRTSCPKHFKISLKCNRWLRLKSNRDIKVGNHLGNILLLKPLFFGGIGRW